MNLQDIKEKVRMVKLSHEGLTSLEIFLKLKFVVGGLEPEDAKLLPGGCHINSKVLRSVLINQDVLEEQLKEIFAHELGHYYLHPYINTYRIYSYDPVWVSKCELEADTFAAEFLIEDDVFIKNPELNTIDLAAKLGVSPSLVELKLKNLDENKKQKLKNLYTGDYDYIISI